jgi:sugar transferase (PEP-CTERM/EpsH1 system associated)
MHHESREITVLHVILSLEIGGMEQVVSDLVQALDRKRFRPVVVCLEALGPIAEELKANGIMVIKLPPMIPKLSFLFPAPLIRVIKETGASVIHVHSGCWYKGAIAGRLAGVGKIIYTEHGRTFPDSKAVILMDRLVSRITSQVVAVSHDLANYLGEIVGVFPGKVSTILNGVDMNRFPVAGSSCGEREVRIGIIARLAPVKDVATLLRAMQIVTRDCPEVLLHVVGDGPERDRLELLAEELCISNKVQFFGFRRDIPKVLAGIDIFTLSSLSEGTSMTILEAMASGKPVVATRVGGNPALIEEGVNGFLVPAGQPAELAGALLRLARDGALRERLGANNRFRTAREYSIQAMVEQYERLYVPS